MMSASSALQTRLMRNIILLSFNLVVPLFKQKLCFIEVFYSLILAASSQGSRMTLTWFTSGIPRTSEGVPLYYLHINLQYFIKVLCLFEF